MVVTRILLLVAGIICGLHTAGFCYPSKDGNNKKIKNDYAQYSNDICEKRCRNFTTIYQQECTDILQTLNKMKQEILNKKNQGCSPEEINSLIKEYKNACNLAYLVLKSGKE